VLPGLLYFCDGLFLKNKKEKKVNAK